MNLVYQNALEESNISLTDFLSSEGQNLLKEKQFYKIIWAKEEINNLTIDGCSYNIEKNQVIFCTPLNHIQTSNNQENLIAIIFNREFYCIRDNDEEVSCNGFLFYGSSYPVIITLKDKEKEEFEMIYGIFQEELEAKHKSQGEMIRAMLKRLIIKGTRLAINKQSKQNLSIEKYDLIRKFHILIEKNFKKRHQVSDYADLLGRSPKTLANVFGKYEDQTPLQIINERILVEARRLLLFSDKTVKEITLELGYKDVSHFSKFFKNNMGSTPMAFRKSMLK